MKVTKENYLTQKGLIDFFFTKEEESTIFESEKLRTIYFYNDEELYKNIDTIDHRQKPFDGLKLGFKEIGKKTRVNFLISGKTGTGKTLMLRWFLRTFELGAEQHGQRNDYLIVYININNVRHPIKILYNLIMSFPEDIRNRQIEAYTQADVKNFKDTGYSPDVYIQIFLNCYLEDGRLLILALDEFDKIFRENDDPKSPSSDLVNRLLYTLCEQSLFPNNTPIPTIIVIVNRKSTFIKNIDPEVFSRFNGQSIEFTPYKKDEIKDILSLRTKAFKQKVINQIDPALESIANFCEVDGNARQARDILYFAGIFANNDKSEFINEKHVNLAIEKSIENEEIGIPLKELNTITTAVLLTVIIARVNCNAKINENPFFSTSTIYSLHEELKDFFKNILVNFSLRGRKTVTRSLNIIEGDISSSLLISTGIKPKFWGIPPETKISSILTGLKHQDFIQNNFKEVFFDKIINKELNIKTKLVYQLE